MTRKETWQKLIGLGVVNGNMPNGPWDLRGKILNQVNLQGANLAHAILSKVDLRGADLGNADLSDADLSRSDLSGANLCNAGLTNANLTYADLSNADLKKANLFDANLSDVDLSKAVLSGADLSDANLDSAVLENTKLNKAIMLRTYVCNAKLHDVDLSEAYLGGADLSDASLIGANLRGAFLTEANLNGANLCDANLEAVDLSGTTLIDAILVGANLSNAYMVDTNLNRADLSNATLTGAIFFCVSTVGWKINGIKAEYLYLTSDYENKEKYIRYFPEGKFEELYRFLPTIELIFKQGLSPLELFKLNAIIEDLKMQNPGLGLNMSRVSIERDAARVDIQTPKEENLAEACGAIQKALKNAEEQGISVNSIMPQIQKLLPFHDANTALAPFHDRKLEINIYSNCTMFVNKGDGTYTQAIGQQSIANTIYYRYAENKAEIDTKFDELKTAVLGSSHSQKEHWARQTDRLIEELREGKDDGKAQKIWTEIKEGIKTGGAIASITSALAALSKFLG